MEEVIMFHLDGDNECYYCFEQYEMQSFAENEGKEIESWGIAVNGMPDGTLHISSHPRIYINYTSDDEKHFGKNNKSTPGFGD